VWDQINRLFRHELVPFPNPASSSTRHPLVHLLRAGAKRLSFRRPHLATLVIAFVCTVQAQDLSPRPPESRPAIPPIIQEPNTDTTYKALRSIGTGEVLTVKNVVLKRDAATFTLTGAITFLAPVRGKVTGAVFFGTGTLELIPPIEVEKKSLAELTKEPALHEEFDQAVFRFTDDTFDELKKQASPAASSEGDPVTALGHVQKYLRKERKYNLDGRILEDVLASNPGGLFWAFIRGRHVSSKLLFSVDPHGLSELGLAPEEVALSTYEDRKWGTWAAFHFSDEYKTHQARGSQYSLTIDIEHQKLDTTFDKSGKLDGIAQTTFLSTVDGLRVVPFRLFSTLRVRNVLDAAGNPLDFIQESKDEDADFFVILPKPMAKGERITLTTIYSGKEAVINVGGGNYFPVARDDWYPNTTFGDYATYELTFRVPKQLTMVATGLPGRNYVEGDQRVTEWKADVPQAVAGFNFATYKKEEATSLEDKYVIEGYANTEGGARSDMLRREVAEAQLAIHLYTDYFGPAPYQRLALTEQPANYFGQSWPALIYLPAMSFQAIYGSSYNAMTHGFTRAVASHEIAHQWFGHTLGIPSYRDNWLSEGFAHFASSLYLQSVYSDQPDTYRDFLKDWKIELLEKNREGKRAIDVGSVTMGYRLGNTKVGFDVNRLIYDKGGYILHMLRMMMWNPRDKDEPFKVMMRDYVRSYYNRISSTEDFKEVVERHMTREMDQQGNGKMDWFFNQFVYGTALPDYSLESSFAPAPNGFTMTAKITQSNVDDAFMMPVPLYLDFGNNKIVRVGSVRMVGNTTVPLSVPLTGITEAPKRALLNYNFDVLSTNNGK
jgi:peptidase M1-like protein